MTTTETRSELQLAGDELAARLREVIEEFGPDEEDETTDLGWLGCERALREWRKVSAEPA